MRDKMKKQRINTTISQKHHQILTKHAEKFGTQQSVLEHALENLENISYQKSELSPELELWMQIYKIKDMISVLPKDYTKTLFDAVDMPYLREYIKNEKPGEFAIEWYYGKPLKECSLQEIINGIILNLKMQNSIDSINYLDNDDHFTINITHSMGVNCSKALVMINKSVLKSYGIHYESQFSERSIFFKILKK